MIPPAPIPSPSSSATLAPASAFVGDGVGVPAGVSATHEVWVSVNPALQLMQCAPSAVQDAPVAAVPSSHVQVKAGGDDDATQLLAAAHVPPVQR